MAQSNQDLKNASECHARIWEAFESDSMFSVDERKQVEVKEEIDNNE